ncbi:MAG: MtaA/CmuA family methyltransferase [Clostridia bacterium]|nr:MtaA/CmuA family methyltransferase [Clostridia bacterium]
MTLSNRERFLRALQGETVDRISVFCADQTGTYEQMEKLQAFWPEAHQKGETMAKLAEGAYSILGFDAVRVPFCQTIEAEALGCKVKDAGKEGIPSIDVHPYHVDDEISFPEDFLQQGRVPELIKAVKILKENVGDKVAVIGGIIGPYSIATSLLGVTDFLKLSVKKPDKLIPYLDVAEQAGTELAKALIEAGADVICIEDMMASMDMISTKIYQTLVAPWQKRQIEQIAVPTILHICGKLNSVMEDIAETGVTAISVEPKVEIRDALERLEKYDRHIPIIGGVDAVTDLFSGEASDVKAVVKEAIKGGYSMIAPGCSIAPATTTSNLLAMVEAAQEDEF